MLKLPQVLRLCWWYMIDYDTSGKGANASPETMAKFGEALGLVPKSNDEPPLIPWFRLGSDEQPATPADLDKLEELVRQTWNDPRQPIVWHHGLEVSLDNNEEEVYKMITLDGKWKLGYKTLSARNAIALGEKVDDQLGIWEDDATIQIDGNSVQYQMTPLADPGGVINAPTIAIGISFRYVNVE